MGNSANNLRRNSILTGHLECVCLSCNVVLNYDSAEAHCLLEEHTTNLQKTAQDYSCTGVRKVPQGYFCELCNLIIQNLVKVQTHVSSPEHAASIQANGEDSCPKIDLKVTPEGIIAFGCLKIHPDAWNAIVNNTCVVCDVDLEDIPAHKEDCLHVVNLIQAGVVQKDYYLYRKIESAVQCLTCNKLIPENKLLRHLETPHHESVFKIACDGRIVKKAVQNYDINKTLEIKNFQSKIDNNSEGGLCLVCDWCIKDSEFKTHPNYYHHQAMLALHNKWLENKNKENRFVILPSKAESTAEDGTNKGVDTNNDPNKESDSKIKEIGSKVRVGVMYFQRKSSDKRDAINNDFSGECNGDTKVNNKTENAVDILTRLDKVRAQITAGSSKDAIGDIHNTFSVECNGDTKVSNKTENAVDKPTKLDKVTAQSTAGSSKDAIGEIKELANEFDLKYKTESNIECTLCKEVIRGSIKNIKAHVNSAKHKANFFKRTNLSSRNYGTKRMSDVQKNSNVFSNVIKNEMIINHTICITLLSYHVFLHEDKGVKCYLCNKFVDPKQHSLNEMHKRIWGNSLMITSFESEFVREVNKGVYHCGFCNVIFKSWDQLSRSHKRHKMAAENSLVMHLKELMQVEISGIRLMRFH